MITKTVNLDSSYESLFEELRVKSDNQIDISNIEEFFGHIEDIAVIDRKFLRLPLDEPMFVINANTRKIEVPTEFKANGLSVQGDHLAETVFFCIDRYFDYTDLGTDTDIIINWKMGSKTGKTRYFILSKDIIPGSLVFGWPISKIVTEKSGALTFAVEINKTNSQNEITYRFNTLAASINIKDGLVIGDDVEVSELDEEILSSLQNSAFGEGEAAVGPITWLTGNGHGLVIGGGPSNNSFVPMEFQSVLHLRTLISADGTPSTITPSLFAQAYVDNQTDISYKQADLTPIDPEYIEVARTLIEVPDREHLDENQVYYVNGTGPASRVATEEEIADSEIQLYMTAPLDQNLVYYVKISDEPLAYERANGEDKAAWGTANAVTLYLAVARIVVDHAGQYKIKAQGQKFDSTGRLIGSGDSDYSEIVNVPSVVTPSGVAISTTNNRDSIEGYSFDASVASNVIFLVDEENALTASAIVGAPEEIGALQFVWQKEINNEFVNISESEVPYIDANSSKYVIPTENGEGNYRVVVKNFQNFGESEAVPSEVYTASALAGKITSVKCQFAVGDDNLADITGNINFNTDPSQTTQAQRNVTLAMTVEAIDGIEGTLEYAWKKNDRVIGNTAQVTVQTEGYYTPVVKNIYNGSIYTYELDPVFINDEAND